MKNVILIATVHQENGECNSNNLLKLINSIKPQVVFEELSDFMFKEVYENGKSVSLETETIKLYLQNREISHYPVDLNNNLDKQFKESITNMFEVFKKYPLYHNLITKLNKSTYELGFSFLNSIHCERLLAQKYFIEQEIAKSTYQEELVQIHQKWIGINDLREREMVSNICKYSEIHDFDMGVFLVGAEHRKPIIDYVRNKSTGWKGQCNWNFDYFDF